MDHPTQSTRGFVNILMHPLAELPFDPVQGPRDPLRYRLTSQSEFPVPLLPAIVRESKEIEGLRSPFPWCPAIHHREPAKLDESGLVWMQLKLKLAQPFLEIVEKPLRVLFALEPDHEVIGIPHDDCCPRGHTGAPFLLESEVEDVVQVDVRENR